MNRWIPAMTSPRPGVHRHARNLTTGLVVLAFATSAFAQSTPMPIPTGPAGGGTPIYVQPPPTSGAVPGQPDASEAVSADSKSRALPTVPAADVGKAQRPRQVTAFPEMTRGIGNSKALLGE